MEFDEFYVLMCILIAIKVRHHTAAKLSRDTDRRRLQARLRYS